MKSDVALDYAVFQLTPSRNRCELVVVCGEETERLASGLLKPFIVHLKAAEDQYATGTKEIKLKPPPGYGYGSKPETSAWFTKGTIERFVRFVSTPEVLERVGTVEAELVQLEGAIREHAMESTKVGASQASTVSAALSAAGSILSTATTDQAPTPTPSRRNSLDEAENPPPDDNARRRLLRAMEARKMLLHKEQGMAFARATAAGFDMQKMEHLLVFADCFGANRLGDACVMYTSIFKKSKESGLWDENEWPLSDTTSLRNVPTSPELRPRECDLWSDMHSEAGDFRLDELRDDVSVRSYSNYYSEDLSLRGYAGGDILRKHAPALSPRRDFNGDFSRSRGGSNQTSWDDGFRISQGGEILGRSYADDVASYSIGNTRRFPSLGSQHSDITYTGSAENVELGNDVDGSNHGGRAQRQRRAWGPPQFLAHQIPVGVKAKSGPLSSDGYPIAMQGSFTPSWVGQSDQPWRPGSTEANALGVPHLLVPKIHAHGAAGNGHLRPTYAAEPVAKPPEANGYTLPSPAASWQEHKRRQGAEVQEKTASGIPAPGSVNVTIPASARGDEERRPAGGKGGDRSQNKPVVRRASSPRRRSSSPMRRVQVGRNNMRRSGVTIMKSVNYASTKPASNAQTASKKSGPSDDDIDDVPAGKNGSVSQQVPSRTDELGRSWREGLRVDTDPEYLATNARSQEFLPDQSPTRASSGWNTPVEYETDYAENGGDRVPQAQTFLSPKEPKGRFYEQYREKRDAKLNAELESKKAERDAKFKSMQEVLEHRKAEMAARKGRGMTKHSSDGEAQVLAEKLRTAKADSLKLKRLKDEEEAKRLEEIANQRRERIAARSSPSPTSAGTASALSTTSPLRAAEKQQCSPTPMTLIPTPSLTPKAKPSAARRLSPRKKGASAAVRSSLSTTPAAAPPAPAAPAAKVVRASQRRPHSAPPNKEVENPLSRSVPNLAELRKENTKPSLVRNSTYNERPRSTGSKLPGMRGASATLESNGSKIGTRAAPADEKKRPVATKKTAPETAPDASVLAPLKSSKTTPADTAKPSKRFSLSSSGTGESKPFLRKGRGIGPVSGPNVRKSKVAAAPEPSKAFGEDAETSISDSEHDPLKAEAGVAGQDAMDSRSSMEDDKEGSVRRDPFEEHAETSISDSEQDPFKVEADVAGQMNSISSTEGSVRPDPNAKQSSLPITRPSTPPQSMSLDLLYDDETIRPEEWQEAELTEPSEDLYKPDDYVMYADLSSENLRSSTLRHFLNEGSENAAGRGMSTTPQRFPIHSIPLRSLSPRGSELPDQYNSPLQNARYDAPLASAADGYSVLDGAMSGSPAMSPAPPQLQLSRSPEAQTSSRLRKKWLSSQKVVAPPAVKESPRGLKRLLKFGLKKKDKSSAASMTSDSPSDIEDDLDLTIEHGPRTDELTHIGAKSLGTRLPSKASGLMGPPAIPEDSATDGDGAVRLVSIPFVRSSIPTAPAHFKTRDEHAGGSSSLLKAPRSFFSLSSLRSKSKQ